MPVPVAEPCDIADRRLPVVGHHDHGIPLEEGVEPAGSEDEPADRLVAAGQHGRRLVRARGMRGVVVVREVEEKEVEPVTGHEPAAHRSRVGVDRAGRTVAEGESRARTLALEEVVEVEALRAEHRPEERARSPGGASARDRP